MCCIIWACFHIIQKFNFYEENNEKSGNCLGCVKFDLKNHIDIILWNVWLEPCAFHICAMCYVCVFVFVFFFLSAWLFADEITRTLIVVINVSIDLDFCECIQQLVFVCKKIISIFWIQLVLFDIYAYLRFYFISHSTLLLLVTIIFRFRCGVICILWVISPFGQTVLTEVRKFEL